MVWVAAVCLHSWKPLQEHLPAVQASNAAAGKAAEEGAVFPSTGVPAGKCAVGGTRLFQNTLPVLTSSPQFQWHPLFTEVAHLGGVLQLPLHALDAEVILTQVAAVPVGPGVQQVSTKSRTALIIKTRK